MASSIGADRYDVALVNQNLSLMGTPITGSLLDNMAIFNDQFTNVTDVDRDIVYSITPHSASSAGDCAGDSFEITVTIDPEPVIDPSLSTKTVCSDTDIEVEFATNGASIGADRYDVSFVRREVSVVGMTTVGILESSRLIFNDQFTNTTNTPGNIVYSVTPHSAATLATGDCEGDDFEVLITIAPEPVGFLDNVAPQCSGTVSYDIQARNINNIVSGGNNVVSSFSYTVLSDNMGVAAAPPRLPANNSVSPINDAYVNKTDTEANITYTITPYAIAGSNCEGDSFDVVFPIESDPVGVDVPTPIAVCSDFDSTNPLTYDLQDNVNSGNSISSEFTYTVSGSLVLETSRTVRSNAPISFNYVNQTSSTKTITYTITPYSDSGNRCSGDSFVVNFDIEPEPVGSDQSEDICGGASSPVNYHIQDAITNSITSIFTYMVSSSDEINLPTPTSLDRTTPSDLDIADNYTNRSRLPVTVTYRVTPFANNATNCQGEIFELNFLIIPGPEGATDTADVCSSVAISYDIYDDNVDRLGNSVAGRYRYTVTAIDLAGNLSPMASTLDRPVPSTEPITDLLTNVGNTSIPITYTITPVNTLGVGCDGTAFTVTFNIDPAPIGTSVIDEVICSGEAATYDLQDNINGNNALTSEFIYSIASSDFANVPTLVDRVVYESTPISIAVDDYLNTTVSAIFITYTVTPRRLATSPSNCIGDSFQIRYQIDPEPVGTDQNIAICSDEPVNFDIDVMASSVSATSFDILVGNPASLTQSAGTVSQGTGKLLNEISDDVWTNQTNVFSTITYTITPMSADGCVGDAFNIVVTINPEPTITPANADLCSNTISGLILASANGVVISNYELTGIIIPADVTIVQSAPLGTYPNGDFLQNDQYVNTSLMDHDVIYKVKAISNNSCQSNVYDIPFTVKPVPNIMDGLGDIVCNNDTSLITLATDPSAVAADDYTLQSITVATGLTENSANIILTSSSFPLNIGVPSLSGHSFTNRTNGPLEVVYEVVPISSGCEGVAKNIILTVEPNISMNIPADVTICSGDLTNISLTTPVNPTSGGLEFSYTAVPSSGVVTGWSTGLTSLGQGYVINDALVNNSDVVQTVTYSIDYSAPLAAGGTSCAGTTTQMVIATVDPIPKMDQVINQSACSGDTFRATLTSPTVLPSGNFVDFSLLSVDYAGGNVTGNLSGGEVVVAGDDIVDDLNNTTTEIQTVTYVFTPRNSRNNVDCVGTEVRFAVIVYPVPSNFTIDALPDQCAESVYLITFNFPVGQAPFSFEYEITDVATGNLVETKNGFGGNTAVSVINGTSPINGFDFTSDFQIVLKKVEDYNDCEVSGILVEQVIPIVKPNANFTINDNTQCNTPGLIDFTLDGGVDVDYIYTWNWGDGSPEEEATSAITSHTYDNPTFSNFTYTVFLKVQHKIIDGCLSFSQQSVTIYPDILPLIFSLKQEVCSGDEVQMFNSTVGVDSHNWSYTVNGVKVVDSQQDQIEQRPLFTFINEDPSYANPQEFILEYTGSKDHGGGDICMESTQYPVFVYKEANARIDTGDRGRIYSLVAGVVEVNFVTNSIPLSDPDFSYAWNYGNGKISSDYYSNSPQRYTVARQYDITHEIVNEVALADGVQCSSSQQITIEVVENPIIPSFSIDIVEGCAPTTFTITNTTEGAANQFTWKVFDGGNVVYQTSQTTDNAGQIEVIEFSFEIFTPGIYTVKLEAENVQSGQIAIETKTDLINVYEVPLARFEMRPNDVVFVPKEQLILFNFTNLGRGAKTEDEHGRSRKVEWLWDFGDGSDPSSDGPDNFYVYERESKDEPEGVFPVSLTASFNYASLTCSNVYRDSIKAEFGGTIETPNAFTPNRNGPEIMPVGPNDLSNDIFLPRAKGVLDGGFRMEIYNRWGVLIFESFDPKIGWNGYFKGELMSQGVYVYKLTLQLANGTIEEKIGDITLLR